MDFEQDYLMRMIKDLVRALACVILGKRFLENEVPEEREFTDTDFLYKSLIEMADAGKINEAENILLTEGQEDRQRYMETAVRFYQHINEYTDEFLIQHQYTREEILEGVQNLAQSCGIHGLEELVT